MKDKARPTDITVTTDTAITNLNEENEDHQPKLGKWLLPSLTAGTFAIVCLTLLQYMSPPSLLSMWGLDHPGIRHFRHTYGIHIPFLYETTYVVLFRFLLVSAWAGYALTIASGLKGKLPSERVIIPLICALSIFMALVWPLSLSIDTYAYAGYARMQVLYNHNPYHYTPQILMDRNDPTVKFLYWNIPTVYGPAWTQLTIVLVRLLSSASLFTQVIALKLVEALALIGAAFLGRAITKHFEPENASLTLFAIGLNPLLLIEGPGNGHNDVLMMCFLLLGILLYLKGKHAAGALGIGLSIAIKFVTASMLPWILLERYGKPRQGNRVASIVAMITASLAPIVLFFIPFWTGSSTFEGISGRWTQGHAGTAGEKHTEVANWLASHAITGPASRLILFLAGQWPLLLAFVLITVWLVRKPCYKGKWIAAWAVFSGCIILFSAGLWFPWYMIWPMTVSLLRWNKTHTKLSFACFGLAIGLTMFYSVYW